MVNIKVKYHHDKLIKLEQVEVGDWIDLRCAEYPNVSLTAGEHKLISLGVSMELPFGYEAHIIPRSSTFLKHGLFQWNHFGLVDSTYKGDDDIWRFTAYAMRDTTIEFNTRICQFRVMRTQPFIQFQEVKSLGNKERGGFGSTGEI